MNINKTHLNGFFTRTFFQSVRLFPLVNNRTWLLASGHNLTSDINKILYEICFLIYLFF